MDFYAIEEFTILQRKFKIKWWNSFKILEKVLKPAISTWLKKQGLFRVTPEETTFLEQKSHASALLIATKTEEEHFVIMQKLIQRRASTSLANSKIAPSEESAPIVDLANKYRDDCYGIFLPIKHNVNK